MQNILTNQTRRILGLKPILHTWGKIEKGNWIYFHQNNVLHKVIQSSHEKGDKLLTEYDANIALDADMNVVSNRGKSKPLNLRSIEKGLSKEIKVTVNLSRKTVLAEGGVRWLPELSFTDIESIDTDIKQEIDRLYGEKVWAEKVADLLNKPKSRQNYKEGDIFCMRVAPKQYVYALLIGSFMKLRKNDFWPLRDSGHFFAHLMCVPIILRKFNFVSDRNDLTLEDIAQHKLMNPEIIMDDLLLKGTFKIAAHKNLVEDDILMPMHYSCYGKHGDGGLTTAFGMGVFDKDNIKGWLESRVPYYKEIYIVFNWGFGGVEMCVSQFLANKYSDDEFIDRCAIGGVAGGLDVNNNLIDSGSIFNNEKLRSIFDTMHIDSDLDFDVFNKKYGGLTRKEYLEVIR